jgi:hypothetical protein
LIMMSAAMRNGKRCFEPLHLILFIYVNVDVFNLLTMFFIFKEEPGESLSDCEKDEEECQEEGSKSDGESEDGFFVPDGYLSDDEVEV